jgi:hypothetical protein
VERAQDRSPSRGRPGSLLGGTNRYVFSFCMQSFLHAMRHPCWYSCHMPCTERVRMQCVCRVCACVFVGVQACTSVRACERACVHACVRACVNSCVRACVYVIMPSCVRACSALESREPRCQHGAHFGMQSFFAWYRILFSMCTRHGMRQIGGAEAQDPISAPT